MKRLLPILLIACAALFSSCRKDIVYSQFISIPSGQWHLDSVARFEIPVTDTTASYRTILYIRHTERYPYQNMWVFVKDSLHSDTIEFFMADDRGRWLGDQHHGFIEMPVLIEENRHLTDTGTYTIEIQHAMRDTLLRGITDIGLEVLKSEK